MKIYIDPGHGGESIGAAYKGRKEQDDCLRLGLRVRDYLLTQKNVEVKMSRTTDVNPELEDRCAEANSWGADYFLSLHRNAFEPNKATGVEIWCYSQVEVSGETYTKAETILNRVCAVSGYRNRGVKLGAPSYKDYAVNRLTKMSSCLLETGFIDNDSDNAIFDTKFNDIATEIARGVYEANGGSWVEEEKPVSQSGATYIVQVGAFNDISNAEAYAENVRKSGFDAFVTVKGDMNGDGKVTAADAREVLNKSVGK